MLRRSTRYTKRSSSPNDDTEAPTLISSSRTKTPKINLHGNIEDKNEERYLQKNEKTPNEQKKSKKIGRRKITDTSSSSESDIEDYLQPIDKIDLNSSFFNISNPKKDEPTFDKIEREIFSGVTVARLSDSDTSDDEDEPIANLIKTSTIPPKEVQTIKSSGAPDDEEKINKFLKEGEKIARINFEKLQAYTKQIEDAKRRIEQYNAKQVQEDDKEEVKIEEKINIEDLLNAGEAKQSNETLMNKSVGSMKLNSSSYETYSDSEEEDWEEIKEKQEHDENSLVPKKELEITLEMPTTMKKKKGDDLLSAVKRRLNRIRKENQLLIHKVHLLCWIAHGNYVNSILSHQDMMALGLSLIPSQKCYPSGRIDLDYLEQILKWYKKTIKLAEKIPSKTKSLNELLTEQIDKKEAYTKKMLVLIFIIILRSLGIPSRLVISLQVEPLRPPNSDLHFLGNSSGNRKTAKAEEKSKNVNNKSEERRGLDKKPCIVEVKDDKDVKNKKEVAPCGRKDDKKSKTDAEGVKKIKLNKDSNKTNKILPNMKNEKLKISGESGGSSKTRIIPNESTENIKAEYSGMVGKNETSSKISSKLSNKEVRQSRPINEKDKVKHMKKSEFKERDSKTRQFKGEGKNLSEKGVTNKTRPSINESESYASRNRKNQSEDKNGEKKNVVKVLDKISRNTRSNSNSPACDSEKNVRSKSTSTLKVRLEKIDENHSKTRSKSASSNNKLMKTSMNKITQLDGSDDGIEEFKGFGISTRSRNTLDACSFEEFYSHKYTEITGGIKPVQNSLRIPQLDGIADEPSTSTPNLKKLKEQTKSNDDCKSRRHRRSTKKTNYLDGTTTDSDDCFVESPKKKFKILDRGKVVEMNKLDDFKSSSKTSCLDVGSSPVKDKERVNLKKLTKLKNNSVEFVGKSSPKQNDVTKDIMQLIKGRISEQKQIDRSRMVKNKKSSKNVYESDDSDYVPEPINKKYHSDSEDEFYPKMKVKQRIQVKKEVKKIKKLKKPKDLNSRKVISSDSEYTEEEVEGERTIQAKADVGKKKRGNDTWLEVFLENEEKWTSVDVILGQVHCVNELYSRASHPVSYILAWDNDNYLKDVTRRYCQNYNTITRKLRIDSLWWEESTKPFHGPNNARDREEDDELNRQQLEKPLPTTISEYKNHPLYALQRHLLKFEAIYPPNAPPLGFVRKEPVYPRDCVYVCHSRDIWLKQAKVVRLGEKPYKIVKARPKYDKLSNTVITDQLLEIFGPWQVKDYEPPTAENGIVPRNAFGNVDLFKPSMLPKKCVHLQLPGLNKVARKMNIDCASAIVGFDFHGGWSHPVYDGFVVCEEYEDQLVAAWNLEQEEIERKEQEKYENRVYGNWKKLIKGLLIKERLKAKYGFGQDVDKSCASTSAGKEKRKSKAPTFCAKKRRLIVDSSGSEEEDKK